MEKREAIQSMLINQKKRSDMISVVFLEYLVKTVENKNFGDESSHSKKSGRTLQSATVEKWKSMLLAKYIADDWLVVKVKKTTNLVKSFNCSVCTKFIDRIPSIKGFQMQWCEDSSKQL